MLLEIEVQINDENTSIIPSSYKPIMVINLVKEV